MIDYIQQSRQFLQNFRSIVKKHKESLASCRENHKSTKKQIETEYQKERTAIETDFKQSEIGIEKDWAKKREAEIQQNSSKKNDLKKKEEQIYEANRLRLAELERKHSKVLSDLNGKYNKLISDIRCHLLFLRRACDEVRAGSISSLRSFVNLNLPAKLVVRDVASDSDLDSFYSQIGKSKTTIENEFGIPYKGYAENNYHSPAGYSGFFRYKWNDKKILKKVDKKFIFIAWLCALAVTLWALIFFLDIEEGNFEVAAGWLELFKDNLWATFLAVFVPLSAASVWTMFINSFWNKPIHRLLNQQNDLFSFYRHFEEKIAPSAERLKRNKLKEADEQLSLDKSRIREQPRSQLDDISMLASNISQEEQVLLKGIDRWKEDKKSETAEIYHNDIQRIEKDYEAKRAEIERKNAANFNAIKDRFDSKMSRLKSDLASFFEDVHGLSTEWKHNRVWLDWRTPETVPPILRYGEFETFVEEHKLSLPALLPFPNNLATLYKTSGETNDHLVENIQSLLLRLLVNVPPGKLRFMFIDPVSLGQNVAPFMHLEDFDPQLISSRVWSEKRHIEQRLVDLTEHMGNVIQKYLRNQYKTIEEFNKEAGEVAEPYRILVVMDFPVNFSEEAAQRLVSIVQNGPRCGVYTVVMWDRKKKLPYNFNSEDLERNATIIEWDGSKAVWRDPDFESCQLELEKPPSEDVMNRLIRKIGKAAVESSKVEVPFGRVLEMDDMAEGNWWKKSTAKGLVAPLGPVGAQKLQYMDLGKGTAQHALICGKTGSGKSTLLHVLITSLMLRYSPDEIEFYLIDFKKGVEFKIYDTYKLPHACVIAIESEREFGLSVLQGLDAELKKRGDLFRSAGVDGLNDYIEKTGLKTPRILLLVDEFQEFFTEDDLLASDVGRILDRLVRQGRAFGIHVFLGSQTLAGAYRLAQSTVDQMAVRIALQCSEADSRFILSDDNPAARLLSRPGEAIYNSANGLVEGNNTFQVAWLTEDEQKSYLQKVRKMADGNGCVREPLVFEGNAPAKPEMSRPLNELLKINAPQTPPAAWLGEPVAIKEATVAAFRRQSGANFVVFGQDKDAALGMLSSAAMSLYAQHEPGHCEFHILDFASMDEKNAHIFGRMAEKLPRNVRYARRRALPQVIDRIAASLDKRNESEDFGQGNHSAVYLMLYGLQRAKDLEFDPYSSSSVPSMDFSFDDDAASAPPPSASPGEQFGRILREGPDMGIHVIAWCDSFKNFCRRLDQNLLREFEMRAVLQMNKDDSFKLIDSEAGSKLGRHRALFYDEDRGRLEKFRPFAVPSEHWLDETLEKLLSIQ